MDKGTTARLSQEFRDEMAVLLGDRWQVGDATCKQHGSSESHFAVSLPDAVAFPRATDEVVEIVPCCSGGDVPIVTYASEARSREIQRQSSAASAWIPQEEPDCDYGGRSMKLTMLQ